MQRTILIVWDESDKRAMFSFYFTRAGYTVQLATDVTTGFEACRHAPPDIAIIRRQLTWHDGGSGLELCQRLRTATDLPHFPILVGDADIGHPDWRVAFHRAYAAGATACFSRVFQIDVVEGMIERLLRDPTVTGLSDR
jgi:CheY-like chemotaxis protein